MYMISLTGPPVMVDVEFKIISIGEIKEAQMVRGTLDLISLHDVARLLPVLLIIYISLHLSCFFISSKATCKPAICLNCHNYHHY